MKCAGTEVSCTWSACFTIIYWLAIVYETRTLNVYLLAVAVVTNLLTVCLCLKWFFELIWEILNFVFNSTQQWWRTWRYRWLLFVRGKQQSLLAHRHHCRFYASRRCAGEPITKEWFSGSRLRSFLVHCLNVCCRLAEELLVLGTGTRHVLTNWVFAELRC